jgi:hypothetical protein
VNTPDVDNCDWAQQFDRIVSCPALESRLAQIDKADTCSPGLQQNCNQTIARPAATAGKIDRINRSVSEFRQLTRDGQFSPP